MEMYFSLPTLRNWIKLFFLVFCLSACQQNKHDYPILADEEKLIDVIADMYIAESALNKQSMSVRDSLRTSFRNNIILIHDLSEEQFDTLFLIVQTDMSTYKDLHKKVVNRLDELNKVKTEDEDTGEDVDISEGVILNKE